MIMYSTRARIAGFAPDVVAWGAEVAKLATRIIGVDVDCGARVGGHQDMVWVARFASMADLDAALQKNEGNAEYLALVKKAVDNDYFDPASVETAIWRTV